MYDYTKDKQICRFNKFEQGFFQIFPEVNCPLLLSFKFKGGSSSVQT